MFFFIGLIVVLGSVAGGYVMHHGQLAVLWQPNEFIIIIGAAIGAYFIGNPMDVIKDSLKNFKFLIKGKPYNKADYIELLSFLFTCLKMIKSKGMLAIEPHLDNPHESALISQYHKIADNHHFVTFFCDNMRLMVMGVDSYIQMEDTMDKEIDIHMHEAHSASGAITNFGEGMPALGIVAAVLGVITTMKSISEPPEILGGLIAAALVGTFTGVLLSYGIVGPIASFMGKYSEEEIQYFQCFKTAIIAHMQGNAPTISIEYGRKVIPFHHRPTFKEVEEALSQLTIPDK